MEERIRAAAGPMARAAGLARMAREAAAAQSRQYVAEVLRLLADLPTPVERAGQLTMLAAEQPPELRDVMLELKLRITYVHMNTATGIKLTQ